MVTRLQSGVQGLWSSLRGMARRADPWEEFHAAGYRPESAVEVYDLLRNNGVRVRYDAVGTAGAHGGTSTFQTLKVRVHYQDLDKARALLSRGPEARDGV